MIVTSPSELSDITIYWPHQIIFVPHYADGHVKVGERGGADLTIEVAYDRRLPPMFGRVLKIHNRDGCPRCVLSPVEHEISVGDIIVYRANAYERVETADGREYFQTDARAYDRRALLAVIEEFDGTHYTVPAAAVGQSCA